MAAWVAAASSTTQGSRLVELTSGLASLLGGVALLLSWRFRSGRVALALLLVSTLEPSWARSLELPIVDPEGLWRLWTAALPWNLALVSWWSEAPLVSRRSALRGSLFLAEIAFFVVLADPARLASWQPHLAQAERWGLWGATVLLLAAFLWKRGPVEAGLLWVVGLVCWAPIEDRSLLVATVFAILLIAVVEVAFGLAWRDELTGLPSRRALEGALEELSGNFAIAMVDVDHFKRFNDRYGHEVGDQVLKRVATELARGARAFRYGGEEFCLLFPGSTAAECRERLEETREAVAERAFVLRGAGRPRRKPRRKKASRGGRKVRVTVSIGVADAARKKNALEVVAAADKALYRAKAAGRNRVEGGGRVARRRTKG